MTTTLSTTAQDIVADAARITGLKTRGENLDPDDVTIALRALNSLIKQWEIRGVKLHTIDDLEIPQYGSKESYTLDDTNLITSWTNVAYDTFSYVFSDIRSAIYTSGGSAHTNTITVETGKQCEVVATFTGVSGQAPTLSGTGGFPDTTLSEGENTISFEATASSIVITATNTAAASWNCTFKFPKGDVDICRPMRVITARRRDNSTLYETPILLLPREEYKQLTIKSSGPAPVTQVAYERQIDYGVLYVWPVSDAEYADPDYSVILTIQRAINIFDNTNTAPDLPSEMYLAVIYGLADLLMDYYGLPRKEEIKIKALDYFNQLLMTDQETVSFFFQPEVR